MVSDSDPAWLYVFAHGAGAGMSHPFMASFSFALAERGIASLRFNFPYMENRKKRPDPPAVAQRAVKQAIESARIASPGARILAGGKSFGGRMTSQLISTGDISDVKALVFAGFPLHPAGAPGVERAAHLSHIKLPMLFLQGTRDALAELSLIQRICNDLPTATLLTFEGADHGFKGGRKDFIPLLADGVQSWLAGLPV